MHAVVPRAWDGGESDLSLMRECIRKCLIAANELKCKGISFPALSTREYEWPYDLCAKIFYGTIVEYEPTPLVHTSNLF